MSDFDIKKIDEMEAMDGGDRLGKFRRARTELGVESFGVAVIDLVPNADGYPDHSHPEDGQEEVYTVISGAGEIEVGGERHPLHPGTMVRVGPGTKRKIWPGEEGMRIVPIGGRRGHAYEPGPNGAPMGLPEGQPEVSDEELSDGDFTVKAIDEMEGVYLGAFKRARAELGAEAFGIQVIDMPPNADVYPEHDHTDGGQEELYFLISGSAEIEMEGERHPIDPGTMVRIGPAVTRKVWTGDEPIRLVIVGATPGEAYEVLPDAITELGQPDPMAQQGQG